MSNARSIAVLVQVRAYANELRQRYLDRANDSSGSESEFEYFAGAEAVGEIVAYLDRKLKEEVNGAVSTD